MPQIFRWLLRGALGLIGLICLALLLVYYFASRSLPDYDGTWTVAGISAPVEIVRDTSDVPHIFGATDQDVFFALGYAHAQDRLWQMTMLRRTAQGRLSELFGERTLQIDSLLRRFDLYGLATRSVDAQDAETRLALEAYSAGVNAWLARVNTVALGRGAPEMWLFNQPIAPWQPADSVAIIKLMALQLSSHLQNEVLRARVSLLLSPDRLRDILPDDPTSAVAALPEYAELIPGVVQFAMNTTPPLDPLSPVNPPDLAGASNAWAAGISRSATGSTLLASDPHLGLTAPSIWYLARLELQSGGVIGATIPGVPLIMSGRSNDLGWGITSSYLDDQDVVIEQVNPLNPDEYRGLNGEWVPFETRDSIVDIAGSAPVTLRLQWSVNGPVLPPEQFDLGTIRPAGMVTVVNWTALSPADTTMTAAFHLMQAHTVAEAIDAAAAYIAPSQNLMLADRNGIGMKLIGAMPARNPAHESQGRLPTFGYKPENRWIGTLPYADNPEFVDPIGGLLGNTNNKITDAPFPNNVSFEWGDTQRIARWQFLMQRREVHTRDSFIEAQLDTVSNTARLLLPLVGADLWFTGEAAADDTPEAQRQKALALLAEWNGEMNEHMPEPLIYAAWMRALQKRLIQDEMGPLAEEFTHVDPIFVQRVFSNTDGAAVWCDVLQSAPVETCDDIARQSLDDAIVWLTGRYGPRMEALRWGDAHQAMIDHPVLGDTPILGWFVNIRQSTSGDDDTLMRGRTSGVDPDPFANVHAAGYRGVYDFADPDSSVFVISTGQSGHPLSRHYDDLGALWRRGEYIPMSLDPDLARAGAVGVTVLTPVPAN